MCNSALNARKAEFRRTVLLACDEAYFPFAALLSTQIAEAHPKRAFDITIMITKDFTIDQAIADLVTRHGIRIILFDTPKTTTPLPVSKHVTIACYQPIFAPRFLQNDYDRILYLDSDILYQRADLSRLFDIDLKGRPVGAVRDQMQHREAGARVQEKRINEVRHGAYLNTGVLLIETQTYLEQNIDALALEAAKSDAGLFHDQSLLNIALRNNWAELAPHWNWPSHHRYLSMQHLIDPCFVHFIGHRKPWNSSALIYNREHVKTYHTFLTRYAPCSLRRHGSLKDTGFAASILLLSKLRGRSDRRRIAPYLAGFNDEWDVK